MKQIYILLIFCLYSITGLSQIRINPSIEIFNSYSFINLNYLSSTDKDATLTNFYSFGLGIGVQLQMQSSDLKIYSTYQVTGMDEFFDPFKYRSQFLGGLVEYCFNNQSKRFRPYLSLLVTSEVATNSENIYLQDDYTFHSFPYETIYSYGSHGGPPYLTTFFSDVYISTPFVGSLTAGCDLRIMKNLQLNLGLGYSLRIIKTKYAEWGEEDDVNVILKSKTAENHYFHMLNVELGFSYIFSFHKNSKTTPKTP